MDAEAAFSVPARSDIAMHADKINNKNDKTTLFLLQIQVDSSLAAILPSKGNSDLLPCYTTANHRLPDSFRSLEYGYSISFLERLPHAKSYSGPWQTKPICKKGRDVRVACSRVELWH